MTVKWKDDIAVYYCPQHHLITNVMKYNTDKGEWE